MSQDYSPGRTNNLIMSFASVAKHLKPLQHRRKGVQDWISNIT